MNEHLVFLSEVTVRPLQVTHITTSVITYEGRGQISHEDSATVAASLSQLFIFF